ncbi:MAG: hypothetical protein NVSMB51_21100 [Solirubrobacteraceae bacterium]
MSLLAIDTPWLLYRSFFALPRSIKDGQGRPANALLGSVNAILNAVGHLRPRAVACCFGAEQAAYRVALYPPYHAHRDPMPDELRAQWQLAPDLLRAFGWAVFEHAELEADDVMHSLALTEQPPGPTLLMTADRDLYQCVTEQTRVLVLERDGPPSQIDRDAVRRLAGVRPSQIPDLIALRGDPSDGIPGAKGVGAKTAAALLREHDTLEEVLRGAAAQSPRLARTLTVQADELRMFKDLATLRRIELAPPPDRETDLAGGAAAAQALGLKRLAERLRA